MARITPAVLCGGVGSRLWPMSRALYPKQLLPLTSDRTMMQETLARVSDGSRFAKPILICNDEHRFLVAAQMQEMQVAHGGILLEPAGRNTAPAVALAALHAMKDDPDAMLLVLAADHRITRPDAFVEAVAAAEVAARDGRLVTFGIQPSAPSTGYGYIRMGEPTAAPGVHDVARFVEKPDAATAEGFLAEGTYRWNAGMFLLSAASYLEELARHAPDILDACRAAMAGAREDLDFVRPDEAAFLACRADSIDYAVMEKSDRAAVVPCDLGWSDIGSWEQLWQVGEKDAQGNVTKGDVLLDGVRDAYVRSEDKLVAVIGLEDVVVVSTADAVLVAAKDRAQDVKAIVDRLKAEGRDEHNTHVRVYRPWGFYEGIHLGDRHQVKHISVDPGSTLSLQKHFHRAEHWVVVRGTALVTRNEEELLVSENESVYLPLGCVHRLQNPGKVPLSIVEVQTGTYLGEDDIVRLEDVYNRAG